MKTPSTLLALLLTAGLAQAATTIHATDRYAYGANVGWIDAHADSTNGVVVGEFFCSGYAYGANIGWIHFGDGSPDNGYAYGNASATDYGVNTEQYSSTGSAYQAKLRGYAYGANVGWINFEAQGDARVDLATGLLHGYAYGANIGWISFDETNVTIRATSIAPGPDSDGDTIPDAWEQFQVGSLALGATATADSDGDGMSDRAEYAADTAPDDGAQKLEIITFVPPRLISGVYKTDLTWTSRPTRQYAIEIDDNLTPPWTNLQNNILPGASTTTFRQVTDTNGTRRFYQIVPKLPLVAP